MCKKTLITTREAARAARPQTLRLVRCKRWAGDTDAPVRLVATRPPPTGRDPGAPTTRAECEAARTYVLPDGTEEIGPCPWVGCVFHLAYEYNPDTGALAETWPGRELDEMPATCALDVGPCTLEEVGRALNLTRERVRQLEASALRKLEGMRGAPEFDGLVRRDERQGGRLRPRVESE